MSLIVDVPGNDHKLGYMYAIVSEDKDGKHGLVADVSKGFTFVTLDYKNVPVLKNMAAIIPKIPGYKMRLAVLKLERFEEI